LFDERDDGGGGLYTKISTFKQLIDFVVYFFMIIRKDVGPVMA
jgi:hypothetical protein